MKVHLSEIAHTRSGDKGDTANVGLIALKDEYYPLLVREVTATRVKEHFTGICKGAVEEVFAACTHYRTATWPHWTRAILSRCSSRPLASTPTGFG